MLMIAKFLRWLIKHNLWGYILTVVVCLIFSGLYSYQRYCEHHHDDYHGLLSSRLEYPMIDARHRWLSQPERADEEIVLVAISEQTLGEYKDQLGRWPWSRRYFARLFRHLRKADLTLVDIGFWEPSKTELTPEAEKRLLRYATGIQSALEKSGYSSAESQAKNFKRFVDKKIQRDDELLARATKKFGTVHHALVFTGEGQIEPWRYKNLTGQYGYKVKDKLNQLPRRTRAAIPVNELLGPSRGVGHINFTPDPDGPARRFKPFIGFQKKKSGFSLFPFQYQRPFIPILSLSGAFQLRGMKPGKSIVRLNGSYLKIGQEIKSPVDNKGNVLINWHGGIRVDKQFQAYKVIPIEKLPGVLPGTKTLKNSPYTSEWFQGKKVFVGVTAAGLFDLRATPFSPNEAGVAIHANILDMFLNDDYLTPIHTRDTLAALVVLTLSVGLIAILLSPVTAFALTVLLIVLYLVLGAGLFNQDYLINLSTPMLSAFTCYLVIISYKVLFEQQKRRQIRGAFEQYLTASVLEEVLEDPGQLSLGGERREITVMFADVAKFTTFSEGRSAGEVAGRINEILTELTESVFEHEGALDKYIGDALVAEFGIVPVEPPEHAERACLAALDMEAKMNKLREQWRRRDEPVMDLRIGLHTGIAATGNMGSELLFDYTAVGDTVNLGSRLEGANKQYGTFTLISESTYEAAKNSIEARKMDRIQVKGKAEPVTIYELLARRKNMDESTRRLKQRFEQALTLYQEGKWKEALTAFEKLHEEYPEDKPTEVFLTRCREFQANPPPEDWNGVYEMTEK